MWDGILFINLGIAPGSTTHPYDPEYSMKFLEEVLAKHAAPSQPLVLMHHFGFDKGHSLGWWPEERRTRYHELLKDRNVVLYLYGHSGTGVSAWAPAGEEHKLTCINDGQATTGFFVVNISGDRLRAAYRLKSRLVFTKAADGRMQHTWDGKWDWKWLVDQKIPAPSSHN